MGRGPAMSAGQGVFLASAACCAAALAAACIIGGVWPAAFAPAVLGLFWIYARLRGLRSPAAAPFALLTLFAAAGVLAGLPSALCLAGVLCALAAWDLHRFLLHRGRAPDNGEARLVERRHLARLAPILGFGGLLGAAGMSLRIRLDTPSLLALAVLLTAGFAGFLGLSKADEGDDDPGDAREGPGVRRT